MDNLSYPKRCFLNQPLENRFHFSEKFKKTISPINKTFSYTNFLKINIFSKRYFNNFLENFTGKSL